MQINSRLPFSSLFFHHWDINGHEMGVLIVKGGFRIEEGGRAQVYLPRRSEILLTDVFHAEPNISPLKQESDLAPFKPKTDIYFHAYARSPEAKDLNSWSVRFTVRQQASYGFKVFGERYWEPYGYGSTREWQLSPSQTLVELPLTYSYAYGGTAQTSEEDVLTHAYNPVGRGLVSAYLLAQGERVLVPQIGLEGEFANLDAESPLTVCGCGPIAKPYLPRLALAGTFDEAWQRERHPRMPVNYDCAFWNAAPLPLQCGPYLQGHETIEVIGLRHDPQPYTFDLPGISLGCQIRREGTLQPESIALNLDTIYCDVSDKDQDQHWMSLTWRVMISQPDKIQEIELFAHQTQETKV